MLLKYFSLALFLLSFSTLGSQHCAAQNPQPPAGSPAAAAKSTDAPTIDQILDKYVKAIGGKAALQAPTSRVMKGTIDVPAIGAKGTIEIYSKAPNKQLTEIASAALGNSREGFNGTVAWSEEGGETKDAPGFNKREADFYLPGKLHELYPKIEFKGSEKIGNHQTYVIEAPRLGRPKRWYFDTETGVLLRTEQRNAMGDITDREDYEDYRAVDGLQICFTIRGIDEHEVEYVVKFSEVKHNVAIDDARFEKPAARTP